MHCLTIVTATPAKLLEVLRKSRVDFSLARDVPSGSLRGAMVPGVAEKIYRAIQDGLTYDFIASQNQVSRNTVMRVGQNPARYGVKGPPIRRSKK